MSPLTGAIATFIAAWVARDVCDIIVAAVTALIVTARRSATRPRTTATTDCLALLNNNDS
ncbi:hypothetical protein GCM10027169_37240 [Gordonia jinhuaensis]|uniref:Uncharacterized protein n=1 Tax=Gordonia jinhuaensis TaxID=1517702 RepID=A0A916T2W7_9ACTN|nr:hypothetical protein [Gordonia jinhuaensis]GGB26394.1 hypothetical protein GCM10011489_13190 [Gordonia jinhuaensis]